MGPPQRSSVMTNHAWRRVVERLTPSEQQDFFVRMAYLAKIAGGLGHDYGIRVLQTGKRHNDDRRNWSNGDDVWAVIRRGEIKTVMFRRSSQPTEAWALRVDKVVLL